MKRPIILTLLLVVSISFSWPIQALCLPDNPTPVTAPTTGSLNSVAHGEGKYVAVGDNGAMVWSADGVNWSILSSGGGTLPQDFFDVHYGDGTFRIVGTLGVVLKIEADELIAGTTPTVSPEMVVTPLPTSEGPVTFVGVANKPNSNAWFAAAWRLESGGFKNFVMEGNCTNGDCIWNRELEFGGLTSSQTYRGVTWGKGACSLDPNGTFSFVQQNGTVNVVSNAGILQRTLSSGLSDIDFVTNDGNFFVAGGANNFISTSIGGGYDSPIPSCPPPPGWNAVEVPPTSLNRVWSDAAERGEVRALAGKRILSGIESGEIGYTESSTDWTPTSSDFYAFTSGFTGIAGGEQGWVVVGGSGSQQDIAFKSCIAPLITNIEAHNRAVNSLAVFQFTATDPASSTLTYNIKINGQDITAAGGSFFAESRVRGDINNDGVVNFADIALYSPSFLKESGDPDFEPYADLDVNGVVNFLDYNLLVDNFLVEFATATPDQIVSVIEWTPPAGLVGQTIPVEITVTGNGDTGIQNFDITIIDPT